LYAAFSGCNLRLRVLGGLPGVEASSEVRDISKAGTTQDAGGNGAAVATFAVDNEELAGIEFAGAIG
jgi:hypothetical protein